MMELMMFISMSLVKELIMKEGYSHLSHPRARSNLLLNIATFNVWLLDLSHYVVFFRAMSHKYKLIYFNARGRAEHVRFIFAYAGVEYQDFRVPKEKWPELRKCESNK